jgi:hypothetical protein
MTRNMDGGETAAIGSTTRTEERPERDPRFRGAPEGPRVLWRDGITAFDRTCEIHASVASKGVTLSFRLLHSPTGTRPDEAAREARD